MRTLPIDSTASFVISHGRGTDGSRQPARKLCDALVTRAYHNGLLELSCGASTARFMPPLNVSADLNMEQ